MVDHLSHLSIAKGYANGKTKAKAEARIKYNKRGIEKQEGNRVYLGHAK